MVHRTYLGLGTIEAAAREFEALRPHVRLLWGLQSRVGYFTADGSAIEVALDALQTAVFHFTRQAHFFGEHDPDPVAPDLTDRNLALAAFHRLQPYHQRLRALQARCRPFGRDWQALNIPLQGVETAAFHFTGTPQFYASCGDSAGAVRAPRGDGR